MSAAVGQWLAMEATGRPPQIAQEARTARRAGASDTDTTEGLTEALSPCHPTCPVCTDTTPPELWDGDWPAYRWTPDLEERT